MYEVRSENNSLARSAVTGKERRSLHISAQLSVSFSLYTTETTLSKSTIVFIVGIY
jgi:hypothetical protein